jgi:predicted RecB family nuclease
MQKFDGRLVFSPSDLNRFLECEYLTRLDVEAANGRVLEMRRYAEADLLAAKGEAHEQLHLAKLRTQGKNVIEISDPGRDPEWSAAAIATRDAMVAGADVIYQAVLIADGWRGLADFLVRVEVPSALGPWSYEVWDTKLARHAKPSHVLQLAFYSERVAAVQRLEPEWMHLVLGSGEPARFRCRDFAAYYRAVRNRFHRAVTESGVVSPYPVSHCRLCGYADHCKALWTAEDHLSLVANIRRSQVERLNDVEVRTCADLASLGAVSVGIGAATLRCRCTSARQANIDTICSRQPTRTASACCPHPHAATCSSTWKASRFSSPRAALNISLEQ